MVCRVYISECRPIYTIMAYFNCISNNAGYISWHDLHLVHEKDDTVKFELKKAPQLTQLVLHRGNNKQSVKLALAIFSQSTNSACTSYFPGRHDVRGFLKLIHTWWTIVNCRQCYTPNPLGNAIIVAEDDRLHFLDAFAEWLLEWDSNRF